MAYTQKAPEWHATGVEPSETQKQTGFQPGMKPPAQWFNWFMNWMYLALKELQEKSAEQSDVDFSLEEIQADIIQLQDDIGNADIPPASLTVAGKVQLSNRTNGTSEALAPTEKALGDVMAAAQSAQAIINNRDGYGTTTNSGNTFAVTLTPSPTAYEDGLRITVKINAANTGAVTINVNGLGAKPVLKSNGSALTSNSLRANSVYSLVYNGANFILQGEGGEYGTAVAGDVRSTKNIGTDGGLVDGTLVTRNTSQTNVTPTTSAQTLQPGIYDYPIVVAGVPAATADLLTQTQSVPANSSRAFNYATQPNIAFVTTSASMSQIHAMMLLGPTPRINHNGTVLFTDTLNPNAYNSALSYSSWNGSRYQIYNNNGVAADLTVEAYFKR